MAFSMVAGWGAKGRAGIALNPIAEIWGVGPCGEEGGSRVGAQFHSVRVAFASEAATVIFPVFRSVSYLNVSLCSRLICWSTFQLGIPNHTLFFQDKYARGDIYCYSSILNT